MLKPYYWLRPQQLYHRCVYKAAGSPDPAIVPLPWGLKIECSSHEMLGKSIIRTGIFELATTEALIRLGDPGELLLDVGANIGYMSSVMATISGPSGRVIAYEPNPVVFQQLRRNVDRWRTRDSAPVDPRQVAVSDASGTAPLSVPDAGSEFAALGERPGARAGDGAFTTTEVVTVRLDDELAGGGRVGVMKLDVEDHEPATLGGAYESLKRQLIRDILFEDHGTYPTATTDALEQHRYTIFDLVSAPLGIAAEEPGHGGDHASWDAPMRIATSNPARVRARLARRGWLSLRPPLRWRSSTQR
jgi:FkbM family methyltransferase